MQKTQYGRTLTSTLAIATIATAAYRWGTLVGIAANTVPANQANEFHVEGVYPVAKPPAETWADGSAIYAIGAAGGAVTFSEASAAGRVFVGHVHAHVEGNWQSDFAGASTGTLRFHGAPVLV
jgi:predicted RecA/RadA family phage recombinase